MNWDGSVAGIPGGEQLHFHDLGSHPSPKPETETSIPNSNAQVTSTPSLNQLAFLDHTWLTNSEDSLILFYREHAGLDWEEVNGYSLNTGTLVDKKGSVEVDTLKLGEYALGIYDKTVTGIDENRPEPIDFRYYPNPNYGTFQ